MVVAARQDTVERKTSTEERGARLPLELILDVMCCLLPEKPRTRMAPSHDTAKTLVSFTRVCRGTNQIASRYLREHCCAHIRSANRLSDIVCSLQALNPWPAGGPATLETLTTLYLAPFKTSITEQGVAEQSTAWWISELFGYVRRTLRRLVIDMPLRADYDNVEERETLRKGFMGLTRLEEFVSVRDELFLSGGEDVDRDLVQDPVWALWPELRRLALYNPDADPEFWRQIAAMSKLESVVLTRPDGIRDSDWCIKTEFFSAAEPDRTIKVVLANAHELESFPPTGAWSAADPQDKMKIVVHDVPWDGHEDIIELCQEHVKTAALEGTIWEWDGHFPSLDG
ncbi:hypothetical protein CONLIGDRAFT_567358 [Coniochaeta ligniaria NRRL 30616]|uniref:F-box domain-containing protein n=1 Tax=Coniochaeta ligniaria NRRL 30616 TaxID=1408157 RepID=A0A1J7JZ28_9PEZI|nr:hypothetical protein CONLIGDRAFT_567358 [Coniochaeta ligniaria NRRL 30616]